MRECSICKHPKLSAINQALAERVPLRDIAARYGVSKTALGRHNSEHLSKFVKQATAAARALVAHNPESGEPLPVKLTEAEDIAAAGQLIGTIKELESKAAALTEKAERDGDVRAALIGVKTQRDVVELRARLSGHFDRPETDVRIRAVIIMPQPSSEPQPEPIDIDVMPGDYR